MQAIVKAALEPAWETRFEANAYGSRPGPGAVVDARRSPAWDSRKQDQQSMKSYKRSDISSCL